MLTLIVTLFVYIVFGIGATCLIAYIKRPTVNDKGLLDFKAVGNGLIGIVAFQVFITTVVTLVNIFAKVDGLEHITMEFYIAVVSLSYGLCSMQIAKYNYKIQQEIEVERKLAL